MVNRGNANNMSALRFEGDAKGRGRTVEGQDKSWSAFEEVMSWDEYLEGWAAEQQLLIKDLFCGNASSE